MIRLGALGDVLRTFPAVHGLRALYPAAEISWLVEPASAGAVEACPVVDRCLVFPRTDLVGRLRSRSPRAALETARAFVSTLRAGRFDLVVDFHGLLKSGVLGRLSGAGRRIGYARPFAREGAWWFATDRARLGVRPISRYARNAGLVEFMGGKEGSAPLGDPAEPARGWITLDPRAALRMDGLLEPDLAPIVLHPGASAGADYKRYPAERMGRAALGLAEATGRPCLVSHGPAERGLAQAVVAASDGGAQLAPSTASFAELAALLARAQVFVGADSGPLHLASLLGVPVVQLLGPTHPVENSPFEATPWRRVHEPQPCSPCRSGCTAPVCMSSLAPAAVVAAALELLPEPRRVAGPPRLAGAGA